MSKYKNKLAIIIPTKDRKQELKRLIESFSVQTCLPEQIIIVDGSLEANEEIKAYGSSIPVVYVHRESGISEARNIGISLLRDDINLVCFLDDDVVMEDDAMPEMMSFWDEAGPDVAGCSFYISNLEPENPKTVFFKRLFLMWSKEYGRVLSGGFNRSPYDPSMKLTYSDWLSGGVTIWRYDVFRQYSFDEWFSGYGAYEDVDFSYRVGKKYRLIMNPRAKVRHLYDTEAKRNETRIGTKEVINRLYFVKKHRELSVARSLWTSMGEMLSYWRSGNRAKAKGVLRGMFLYIRHGSSVFSKRI